MYTQSHFKNNYYINSNRTYSDDYSNTISKKYDMTMSGKYLGEYPPFEINIKSFDKYPSHYIINKLANKVKKIYQLDKQVVIGSGSNGLLQNLIKIFFVNGGNLVTPYYTFNQAEYGVSALNGFTKRVYMNKENIDFNNLLNSIDDDTRLIYICNPNNPTGIYIPIVDLLNNLKNVSIPIIVDESSIEFAQDESLLNYKFPPNIIVLRSFSKAYGLANLQVGYMACSKEIKKLYQQKITVNEVSGLSCEIALKFLKSDYYIKNVEKILKYKKIMEDELKKMGIYIYESKSNIILTSTTFSNNFIEELSKNNVSVVMVEDINKKYHIRIAIQDEKTNNAFLSIINKILKCRGGIFND